MTQLHRLSALELRSLLRSGALSPAEPVEHFLNRISALDESLGAFTLVTAGAARERAQHPGLRTTVLSGIPSADKDLSNRAGVRTGFGSRLPGPAAAELSDELVQRGDRAGLISLGKTSTPEFGMTGYTESAAFGPTRNPYDPALGPGGSSGGAAVAVAAGLVPFAPGSDGGGSVRIPAAATGLIGLKPSRGVFPLGSEHPAQLAVPGVLARSAADAALLYGALLEPETPPEELPYLGAARHDQPFGALRIGLLWDSPLRHGFEVPLDPELRARTQRLAEQLGALGHLVEETSLDGDERYPQFFTTLWQSIAAGIPADDGTAELLEPFTAWLWQQGRALAPAELETALTDAADFTQRTRSRFAAYDLVLSPALGTPPPPVGAFDGLGPEDNFALQCRFSPYTSFVNVIGLPAIAVPIGLSDSGMPVGAQFIAGMHQEPLLLRLAAQLEAAGILQHSHPAGW